MWAMLNNDFCVAMLCQPAMVQSFVIFAFVVFAGAFPFLEMSNVDFLLLEFTK